MVLHWTQFNHRMKTNLLKAALGWRRRQSHFHQSHVLNGHISPQQVVRSPVTPQSSWNVLEPQHGAARQLLPSSLPALHSPGLMNPNVGWQWACACAKLPGMPPPAPTEMGLLKNQQSLPAARQVLGDSQIVRHPPGSWATPSAEAAMQQQQWVPGAGRRGARRHRRRRC